MAQDNPDQSCNGETALDARPTRHKLPGRPPKSMPLPFTAKKKSPFQSDETLRQLRQLPSFGSFHLAPAEGQNRAPCFHSTESLTILISHERTGRISLQQHAEDLAVTSSHLLLSIAVVKNRRFFAKTPASELPGAALPCAGARLRQISLISNPWLESFTSIPSGQFLACIFLSTESKSNTDNLKSPYILHHQVTKEKKT